MCQKQTPTTWTKRCQKKQYLFRSSYSDVSSKVFVVVLNSYCRKIPRTHQCYSPLGSRLPLFVKRDAQRIHTKKNTHLTNISTRRTKCFRVSFYNYIILWPILDIAITHRTLKVNVRKLRIDVLRSLTKLSLGLFSEGND